jgi:hypothetical protein
MEIYNSWASIVASFSHGLVYVENSRIRTYIQVDDVGSIVYGYHVTSSGPTPFQVYENGGRYIILGKPGRPWP